MTHCFGRPGGLEHLVRFTEKLCEESELEVLFGLDFSRQPTQGWELPNKDTQRRLAS